MSTELVGRSFADLGEPIQRLLQQIQRNLTNEELDIFSKVSVRQLAKVYDMLSLQEDPERILDWLKKEHMKAKGIDPEEINGKRRIRVLNEGGKDPIGYYKKLEKKNLELLAEFKRAEELREKKRTENIAERRRRREEYQKRIAEAKEKEEHGEHESQLMEPEKLSDILGTFERFTSRLSTFDNSNSVQDVEWWKRDDYRRDYEKNGVRGVRWTSVVEGGSLRAPDSEIQVREEWYRLQCWWKTDNQRRNWAAFYDTEWWKEELYITDWLENGDDGLMWTAADEISGYNRRGNVRKAVKVELDNRVQWYKANGPKGIVKTWCAFAENSKERCTVEEKYERDDYFKNGDWWKSEIYVNCVRDNPAECSALHNASAAVTDQEWWKQPAIRADFEIGGVLWKALNEELCVRGLNDFANEDEIEKRKNWFNTYWWKGEKYIKDYENNGFEGKLWRASEPGSATIADAALLRSREEWYFGCRETEWWKNPKYIQDWVDNGEDGLLWTAAWRNAAVQGDIKNRASLDVLKQRIKYYEENFWKQRKYIKDYISFGENGVLWKANHHFAAGDFDWWKSPFFFGQWVLASCAFPGDFWKEPEAISDYWEHLADGKKWTASNAVSASFNRGDVDRASSSELTRREKFYKKYWWRQEKYYSDFCAKGTKWTLVSPNGSERCSHAELRVRRDFFQPRYYSRIILGYQRLTELDAVSPVTGLFAYHDELCLRDEYYRTGWWRTSSGLTDYAFKGNTSFYINVDSYDDARALKEANFSSPVQAASRMLFFDTGCVDYSADNEYIGEFISVADWWQEPAIISDFLNNGDGGKKWRANNSASGTCGYADEDVSSIAEQNYRKAFYMANFWRSLECLKDFWLNGIRGKLWVTSGPHGKGKRVDEKHLLARAQILSGYPHESWLNEMNADWWKAPEVRADYYVNGESGCMVGAKNAYVAVERLGSKMEYRADPAEIRKRVEYYDTNPVSIEDGEKCHYLYLIEPFWITPESVEDYWANGLKGKKWTAVNAAAFSCSLGDKFTATSAELQRREGVLQSLFWRASSYKNDFLSYGRDGKLWKNSEFDGLGSTISHEEQVVRISYYLRLSEKFWSDCRYAANNWWKAPEVRHDYNVNGFQGALFGASTSAVAVMGLSKKDKYAATEEEKRKRSNYFDNHLHRDSRVPEALLSRELKRVTAMGELFWVHYDCLEDYVINGYKGTMWLAGDVASSSIGSLDFRAKSEDVRLREDFFKSFWWKASKYRLDFLQHGFRGSLWSKNAPNGGGTEVSGDEMIARICYYACAGLECEKRLEEFALCWWKSPDSVAHFMFDPEGSMHIIARSPQVALSQSEMSGGMGAHTSAVDNRRHYMIMVASTDDADDITDTQIMRGIKPVNGMWWKNEAYQREYDTQRPLEHWKSPECISDYFNNGTKGKKWTVSGYFFPINMNESCSKEELKERELYYAENFWKSPESRRDYQKNGLKGILWTSSEPNARGKPVSQVELNVRMTYYKPSFYWELAIDPGTDAKSTWCGPHEDMIRCRWYKTNWWKCILKDDYWIHGMESKLLRAPCLKALLSCSTTQPECEITEEEAENRMAYFDGLGENEWWQNPVILEDFQKGEKCSMWNARNFKEALLRMGLECPADQVELERRKRWYQANWWKSCEMIKDYAAGGNKWNSAASPDDKVLREKWMKMFKPIALDEEAKRKKWLNHQLADEQLNVRRAWLLQRSQDARRIHLTELGDLLTQLNDGVRPSDNEIEAIEDAIRAGNEECHTLEGITQQDLIRAMKVTNFYIEATEEEKLRSEQEVLEALQKEEMDRLEEEAAHLAQEALEELEAAGEEYISADDVANSEEEEYLRALEEQENMRLHLNEDDVDVGWVSEQDEDLEEGGEEATETTGSDCLEDTKERQQTLEAIFATEGHGGEVDEEDTEATKGELVDEVKAALEDVVKDESWKNDEFSELNEAKEQMVDNTTVVDTFTLPLKEVPNLQYLKGFFTLMKYTPSIKFISSNLKRVWVVDHFTQSFYSLTKNNFIRKEHLAKNLIQLEKNIADSTRLRMMFFDASHSYDVQFVNAMERERFYETASAIRPSIRVFAPALVREGDMCSHVCIDGTGTNARSVICPDSTGKPLKRQLVGECRMNTSRSLTESVSIWCGTYDLGGKRPPKCMDNFEKWMPRGAYDIYAVAVQNASFRSGDSEWTDYLLEYLGDSYLPITNVFLKDIMLTIITRKRNLLKLTNLEASTRKTVLKSQCGNKGGIFISVRYFETSICFATCHLPARAEQCTLRNTVLDEVLGNITLGIPRADVTNQFDYMFFFGNFNYRCDVPFSEAESFIQSKNYNQLLVHDQLNRQRKTMGILYGFEEPAISFAPTYRFSVGTTDYVNSSPSYCDRVFYKRMPNAWIKCTGYTSDQDLRISESRPVSATFVVRCVRPIMSCFMPVQEPVPEFVFDDISLKNYKGCVIKKPMLYIRASFMPNVDPIISSERNTISPIWQRESLPRIASVTQVQEYLETQNIIFVVYDASEKQEIKQGRGTAVLTLKECVIGKEGEFFTYVSDVVHRGKCIGKLVGSFGWRAFTRDS